MAVTSPLLVIPPANQPSAQGYVLEIHTVFFLSWVTEMCIRDRVGPNGDNHLDGYGIDAPINPRQLQIKHLRACN